jgi:IS30 family transposase
VIERGHHRPRSTFRAADQEIQDIVITANLTPRKCLGFKTPFQAILKELGKDVQIRFT